MTGVGPVPVGVVREMIASGDVFLAAIVTKGKDVVNVAHLGRRPSASLPIFSHRSTMPCERTSASDPRGAIRTGRR